MTEEEKWPHDIHDRGYKLLFSFTKIFQQLIEGYVEGDWKSRLDYGKSQRIDKTFILKGLEKEESDILYKVPLLGEKEKEIFLYVLIEQQSTVDYSLAFRVLLYLVDIWTEVYKNTDEKSRRQKGFRLPPVLPIVLYNGSNPWTAETSLKGLVEEGEKFGDFIPNVRYHLIDIPRYDIEKLKEIGNSLSGVFLLEHESDELESSLKEALEMIAKEPNEELWKAIIEWIKPKLKQNLPEKAGEILENLDLEKYSRKEINTMLETMPRKMFDLGEQKGLQKGIQKGVKESIAKVLQSRFGKLSPELKDHLNAVVALEDLESLLETAANVKTLAEFKEALSKVGENE